MAILLFAAGVCGLQSLSALPPAAVLAGCAGLSTAAAVAAFHQRRRSPVTASLLLGVAAICSGFLWAAWRAEIRLADELPAAWEGRDVVLRGRVADLPQQLRVAPAPLKLERGANALWNKGGLMYAPPLR